MFHSDSALEMSNSPKKTQKLKSVPEYFTTKIKNKARPILFFCFKEKTTKNKITSQGIIPSK